MGMNGQDGQSDSLQLAFTLGIQRNFPTAEILTWRRQCCVTREIMLQAHRRDAISRPQAS